MAHKTSKRYMWEAFTKALSSATTGINNAKRTKTATTTKQTKESCR